ncbi:universal stress protein [Streptomyces sp. NPDC102406]|uniref:universal stress protein n=1 Tax=Streptomyces sp. NPDC102406 TaxID=3366171 RepID=UPI00381A4DDE
MELPLVVGVDGSDPSLEAVDWAVDEAARHGLGLRVVYAFLWSRYEGTAYAAPLDTSSEQALAENIVSEAAERARRRNPEVKLSTTMAPQEPVNALLDEGRDAWAVVTGSRGRGELKGLLLGSVGLSVAARSHDPVIVVRGDEAGVTGAHERILFAAGDAAADSAALRFAFREARARHCLLDVVRTWRCPTHESPGARGAEHQHEEQAQHFLAAVLEDAVVAHPDVRINPVTVEGPAHKVLAHRSAAADLLVIGARRRHGHFGLQLGRVGHALLHQARCPVAIVPDTA